MFNFNVFQVSTMSGTSVKAKSAENESFLSNCIDCVVQKVVNSSYYKMRTPVKVLCLWSGILVISGIKVFFEIPPSFFSHKRNFLNIYFVKWSWLWTLVLMGPYMIATSFVYGCTMWKRTVLCAVVRLAIGTLVWYTWVNVVFHFVENLTGVCLDANGLPKLAVVQKKDCLLLKSGHIWDAIDISGHAFLLTYCVLFCKSELDIQTNWKYIPTHAASHLPIGSKALSSVKGKYKLTLPAVQFLFLSNVVLGFLWEVMLVTTCIYFHSFYSKAFGAACGIISWMMTYNEWYKHKLSPGQSGEGPLGGILLAKKKNFKSQ